MLPLLLVLLSTKNVQSFFLADKTDSFVFCFKVCPLYCSPRRIDDWSSYEYVDDEVVPYPYIEESQYPPRFGYPYHCRHTSPKPTSSTTTTPKPTTTTMSPKPKTTTEEPTWICMVCMKKCNFSG